jgi:ADP-ribose/FAD diphosphatase
VPRLCPGSRFLGPRYPCHRADLDEPHTFRPGTETLETRLFAPEDIPFGEIAFSAITVVLQLLVEDLRAGSFRVHQGVIHKKDGFSPSDPNGYELRDHVAVLTTVRTPGASTSPSVN